MNIRIKKSMVKVSVAGLLLIIVFFFLVNTLVGTLPEAQNINLLTIFLTGLLTGGLTCLAVQGGLLAATIAQREEAKLAEGSKETGNALPILSFLTAKLIAYTLLGFLLGWFGSLFQLSLQMQIIMQFVVVVFMLGTALNILDVHPIFRYFVLQPPRFLTQLVRKQSKSKDVFAPALLGAFTVFIPCGTTQAMMALAIGSGSPVVGAAILFSFILGTSPLFFTLGYFATKLGDAFHKKFMKIAALAIILLALFNVNNTLALTGHSITFPDIFSPAASSSITPASGTFTTERITSPVNQATIEFTQTSYIPDFITVKAGSNVKLHLVNNRGRGCIQAFTIPELGVQKIVSVGSSDSLEFIAPETPGEIEFMCSMGMYRGVINVI